MEFLMAGSLLIGLVLVFLLLLHLGDETMGCAGLVLAALLILGSCSSLLFGEGWS